jgi:biopolymer transport protein ExbD
LSVVRLEVSELGAYSVDGRPVEGVALRDALLAKRRPGEPLLVHIVPSPKANYEAVEAAVKAARDSSATIGMVGNERF